MPRKKICKCGRIIDETATCSCKIVSDRVRNKEKNERYAEQTKILKSVRWRKFRKVIIDRDDGYCQRCLIKYNVIVSSSLEVHHIKPRSKYPELVFEDTNCITLCKTCNLQIGTSEVLDFNFKPNEREFTL